MLFLNGYFQVSYDERHFSYTEDKLSPVVKTTTVASGKHDTPSSHVSLGLGAVFRWHIPLL